MTLHRMTRAVLPGRVRRRLRSLRTKARIVTSYGGLGRAPVAAARYVLLDHELDNFTYPIANTGELVDFIADAMAVDRSIVAGFVAELRDDAELGAAIRARLAGRPDRNATMPFGRRLGWYAVARIRRPSLVVETGLHDGLGATVLLRALERNRAEGHGGSLVSIDIRPAAGWLIPDRLRPGHEVVIGDSLRQLEQQVGDRRIGMFIHDSDHRYEHETAELEIAARLAERQAVLMSDNAHAGPALADFCTRHGLRYRYWHEVPQGHFYPGAGIGLTVIGGA
jgi:hypothetical protein